MNVSVSSVSGQSSASWETVREIIQNPDQFSSSHNINAIIESLSKNMSCWDDEQRGKERRQALWVIAIVLFVYGWDNSQNRQRVINTMYEWKIDQAIFYELKDTAEIYSMITTESNKSDLDKSINDLIELG